MSNPLAVLREWDAEAYHRLSDPQVGWGLGVLERLALRGDERVLDAGCGTGRLTASLLARLPNGTVVAADRSMAMLKAARQHLEPVSPGKSAYLLCDLADLPLRDAVDAVVSTATFHWLTDHPRLFANLRAALHRGGWLEAQCGGKGNLDGFRARARRLLDGPPFAGHVAAGADPWEYADASTTAQRLEAAGFVDVQCSLFGAPTTLPDAATYAAFIRTVVLRVHLARLPDDDLRQRLLDLLTEEAADDDPPFTLDYVRLNLAGRAG
jgi:trans-aconitate methyltransferase